MTRRFLVVNAALTLSLLPTPGTVGRAFAQEPPVTTFRSSIDVVSVSAVVRDRKWIGLPAVVGSAHLHDLEESLLLAREFALGQGDETIDDGEDRTGLQVGHGELAEEQSGAFPGHHLHGELVADLAQLSP